MLLPVLTDETWRLLREILPGGFFCWRWQWGGYMRWEGMGSEGDGPVDFLGGELVRE